MANFPGNFLRVTLGGTALAVMALVGPVAAESVFTPTGLGFVGNVSASSAERGKPIVAGGKAVIAGTGLLPGQEITLQRGATVLSGDTPVIVDAEGNFSVEVDVDSEASVGLQPVLVIAEKPAAATVVEVKVSPDLPLSGAEKFEATVVATPASPYQTAYSAASNAIFVTAAVGRPPVTDSTLSKVDATTLETLASINPAAAPARPDGSDGGLFAVYGIAVDDVNGNVWVTNTRQNTLSVYSQADLSLVKQFEPGVTPHAFSVEIDAAKGRAFVSLGRGATIEVFDTTTLEHVGSVALQSTVRGQSFGGQDIDLDAESGTLVAVSNTTAEIAVLDTETLEARVLPVAGLRSASSIAYDAKDDVVFIVAQGSDNVVIAKASDGSVLHDVKTGAGALYVTFEPVSGLAFVANRGAGTVTVVSPAGEVVANLDAGSLPNEVKADGLGNVWLVNKSLGDEDATGNRLHKLTPVAQ
ncbi:ATP-binding protein [Pseudogemmobacter sonorensis]|uniref:ATP-binding protein n=1 Tax=Pseudogemmobacter sonorensis TaxID=2989681 RepID=UPI0036C41C72